MGHTGAILFNICACLELTLYNGVHPLPGIQIGPQTGTFEQFTSFSSFYEAFIKQLNNMIGLSVDCNTRYAEAHKHLAPTPLLSSLIEGSLEKGRDITDGGAIYNSSGVSIIGFSDVVDSLAATKQLIFEEKRISPEELLNALKDNFAGHDKIYAMVSRRGPKYGTDNNAADDIAIDLVKQIGGEFNRYKNPRGGFYHVGYWSMTLHTGLGSLSGALPNGKKQGEPFASGATPCSIEINKGPTASLSSTAKLPGDFIANGMANNHRIPKSLISQTGKLNNFVKLIKGYFQKGGMQVQFIIQDKKTLIDALEHPENYNDLLVRVSGYTAYFNDLTDNMKREIISRAEDMV